MDTPIGSSTDTAIRSALRVLASHLEARPSGTPRDLLDALRTWPAPDVRHLDAALRTVALDAEAAAAEYWTLGDASAGRTHDDTYRAAYMLGLAVGHATLWGRPATAALIADRARRALERTGHAAARRSMIKDGSPPTVAHCVAAIDLPARHWVGQCTYVADELVAAGTLPGRVACGRWTGPVSARSPFTWNPDRTWWVHRSHGWVVLGDGRVADPTRWVFEAARPYVYVGPADHYAESRESLVYAAVGRRGPFVFTGVPAHVAARVAEDGSLRDAAWLSAGPVRRIRAGQVAYVSARQREAVEGVDLVVR